MSPEESPQPRVKGRSHSLESRQKISAANRGKVPWNKGRPQTEETKAKIRQGVLRRLEEKERLNPKPPPDPNAPKKQRTRKRGDPLPYEIRARISETMKKKWANATYVEERKRAREVLYEAAVKNATLADGSVDYSKVNVIGMAGRKHSKETRDKISQTLKARWETEDGFRDRMVTMMRMARGNEEGAVPEETRKKISEKLKKRWREEEGFREKMMVGIKARAGASSPRAEEHRKKISDAIRAKWAEDGYRKRATDGMKRSLAERAAKGEVKELGKKRNSKVKSAKKKKEEKEEKVLLVKKKEVQLVKKKEVQLVKKEEVQLVKKEEVQLVNKEEEVEPPMKKVKQKLTSPTKEQEEEDDEIEMDLEFELDMEPAELDLKDLQPHSMSPQSSPNPDLSNMSALKRERYSELSRDVWNLLYGDDDEFVDDDDADGSQKATTTVTRSY
ncbi:hypothetical protein TrRE_jg11825 [Triparma retinervis]|uniref:Nuclease associated modular domain-containing protein n=1 Tax=Triparma retinervis TaxID=2557542 RepID=A0A9W6ZFA1_9STRA|nr:hypothetical protein TrRE_jg11825 [Triparma retinervis]